MITIPQMIIREYCHDILPLNANNANPITPIMAIDFVTLCLTPHDNVHSVIPIGSSS
nr:hypothetical protein [Rickettsia sp. TH2014]